jgi:hypothetical protein
MLPAASRCLSDRTSSSPKVPPMRLLPCRSLGRYRSSPHTTLRGGRVHSRVWGATTHGAWQPAVWNTCRQAASAEHLQRT